MSEPIYDLDEDEPVSISGKVTKKRAPLKRTLIAVAAVIVILVGGTIIASANGTDLWGTIISWTAETFGFREKAGADRQIPEQLEQLAEYFDQYNISREKLPTYIPEGYVNIETNASLLGADLLFVCGLNNNDKTIIIRYELHRGESFNTLIEKDGDDPEVFKLGDRTFYLFTNESIPCAAWMDGNLECIIFGAESREELIKIIESIYGGKLK